MQVATSTAAKAVPEMGEEEERYVKVASRFFRVKPRGGAVMTRGLHYLDSCFLCKKDIAGNRDIFMYKGDAAFCSEDCRDEQMYMDEALDAVAWRHRRLPRATRSSSSSQTAACTAARGEEAPMMRRRPTIANLSARNPPVAAR